MNIFHHSPRTQGGKKIMKMKIAILTGGGDCPGLNGAVKWVTKSALDPRIAVNRSISFEVLGITEARISQIHSQAVLSLRTCLKKRLK